jgi:hypothetical protein
MAEQTGTPDVISMDARARAMLAELVNAGGAARYVRIHVGRG